MRMLLKMKTLAVCWLFLTTVQLTQATTGEDAKDDAQFFKAVDVLNNYEQKLHKLQEQTANLDDLFRDKDRARLASISKWVSGKLGAHIKQIEEGVRRNPWLGGTKSTRAYLEPDKAEVLALAKLTSLASFGHEQAMFVMAERMMYGKYGQPANVDSAFEYYSRLAATTGNATAQYMVGFIYGVGLGSVQQDIMLSSMYLGLAALQGHTEAEMTLGFRHLMGIGAPMSCQDALAHYKSVADKAAQHYLKGPPLGRKMPDYRVRLSDERGGVYGVKVGPQSLFKSTNRENFNELLEVHTLNAKMGELRGCLTLVDLYYHGHRYAPTNYGLTLKYMQAIRQQTFVGQTTTLQEGLDQAEINAAVEVAGLYGVMLWRGEGVAENLDEAVKWLRSSTDLGYGLAQNALGVMYQLGVGSLEVDLEQAAELFKKSAERKHAGGLVNHALMVFDKQPEAGLASLNLAAEKGHLLAHYYLGRLYAGKTDNEEATCRMAAASYRFVAEKGDWLHSPIPAAMRAVQKGNIEAAAVDYMRAAEMGYDVGQLNAALLLENVDIEQICSGDRRRCNRLALAYWTRAANQGVGDARVRQADYYFEGRGVNRSYAKAAAAYGLAADGELNGLAMWNLGWMYEMGVGVARDFHLAKRWYDRSLEVNPEGHLAGQLSLARLCVKYLWAIVTGKDVGEGSLFFAPKPVAEKEEEAVEEENGDSGKEDEEENSSLGESAFIAMVLVGLGFMVWPRR